MGFSTGLGGAPRSVERVFCVFVGVGFLAVAAMLPIPLG